MFEIITGGLILSTISALTFLAYSHSRHFLALVWWLLAFGFLLWAGVWGVAVDMTYIAIIREVEISSIEGGREQLERATDPLKPSMWILILGFPLWMVFLMILGLGVTTLKDDEKGK